MRMIKARPRRKHQQKMTYRIIPSQLQELKQMFAMYDKDKSGHLEYTVGMAGVCNHSSGWERGEGGNEWQA